jgi:hypothetical protein
MERPEVIALHDRETGESVVRFTTRACASTGCVADVSSAAPPHMVTKLGLP